MPLSRANSIGPGPGPGGRDPLFHTLLTPRGSRPSTPSFSPSAGTPRPRRSWPFVAVNAVLIATSSILLLLTAVMYLPDSDLYYWKRHGCQTKILEMNGRINATLQASRRHFSDTWKMHLKRNLLSRYLFFEFPY